MSERRRNVEPAHYQTCQWILDLAKYKDWKAATRGLLWIKGKPGSGKSTVMSHLYSNIHKQQSTSTDIQLEFFFSARGVPLQRSPIGMLRSLMYQIFHQNPNICNSLRKLFSDKCTSFGGSESSWEWQLPELRTVFLDIVSTSAQDRQITIFIDALDEAGDQFARETAHYFHTMNDLVGRRQGSARICISCRHYPIPSTAHTTEIHVEDHNRGDIKAYVQDYIRPDNLLPDLVRRQQEWLDLVENLVESAHGVFQWAILTVPMVSRWMSDGETPDGVHERLKDVPPELEGVYEHILQHVINRQHIRKSLRLFQWISVALRPLYVGEVRHMMAVLDTESATAGARYDRAAGLTGIEREMEPRIRAWSGGLIEIVSSGVPDEMNDSTKTVTVLQVIHQSVKDFLIKGGLKLIIDLDPSTQMSAPAGDISLQTCETIQLSHAALYLSCLKVLFMEDLKVLPDHGHAEYTESDQDSDDVFFRQFKEALISRSIEYAATYCLTHAEKAKEFRHQDLEQESRCLNQIISVLRYSQTLHYSEDDSRGPHGDIKLLHVAAAAGLEDICRHRICSRDDLHAEDTFGWNALHFAAANGHTTVLKMLFDAGLDIQKSTKNNQTALILAAAKGQSEVFSWLMTNGANFYSSNDTSDHVLYVAAANLHLSICKLCIAAGVDVNAQGGEYGTALQAAAYDGGIEVVRLLLDAGADVNAQGGHYGTALQAASSMNKRDVISVLRSAGAKSPPASLSDCNEEIPMARDGRFGEYDPSRGDIHDEMDVDGDVDAMVVDETSDSCLIVSDTGIPEGGWLLQLLGRFFP